MSTPIVTSYNYTTPPASQDAASLALHQFSENRKISQSIQSIVAVVQRQGATLSSNAFGATGVRAGTYANPSLTVSQDGRITQIATGDSPFPKGGQSGQFLASDGNGGVSWRWAASGGASGGGGGSSSTTIQGPKPVNSADLAVSTPTATTFALSLKPTGVTAGSYANPDITVDAAGRVTAIKTVTPATPIYETQLWRSPVQTLWAVTMSNAGTFTTTLQTASDAITAEDGLTMILTEDGADYIAY